MEGKMIIFEGIDGSGKGTILNKLFSEQNDILEKNDYTGIDFFTEPDKDSYAREMVLDPRALNVFLGGDVINSDLSMYQQYHMFMALRATTMHKIYSRIKCGNLCLVDRSFVSTMVYQDKCTEMAHENILIANFHLLNMVSKIVGIKEFLPNKIIFLDISPETCLNRLEGKSLNGLDPKTIERATRLITLYRIAIKEVSNCDLFGKTRVEIIDANRDIDSVYTDVKKLL